MLPIMMRICIIHFGFLSMLANALYIPDRSTTNAELNYRNMNITDFNFALVEVENLSSETLYINLEGNDLTSMPDNIAMYFSQMERIILNDNLRLSFPPDGSPFLRSPSLIELICERCGIHKIFTRSLRHLPHLEYLWLSDNQINQIAPYAFRRNQRLQNVDLSFNKLYTVPADMLKGLFRMKQCSAGAQVQLLWIYGIIRGNFFGLDQPQGAAPGRKSNSGNSIPTRSCSFDYSTRIAIIIRQK
ncbi:extracellular matrix protein 2-like isoform X2 [Aedes albopictus]|uniref:Uncharacterized protein n=1 Tax=Aedes albopictus TaxID=7160 RepID=A0ABM1YZY2_AEDAL